MNSQLSITVKGEEATVMKNYMNEIFNDANERNDRMVSAQLSDLSYDEYEDGYENREEEDVEIKIQQE